MASNPGNLQWWESWLYGVLLIMDGLTRVLSFGFFRSGIALQFSMWRLIKGCEALED